MIRTLVALLLILGQDPAVELVYRLKFPDDFKGDRKATSARTLELVRRRLAALQPKAAVKAGDGETLVVTAPLDSAFEVRKAVGRPGTLALKMTAELLVQEAFTLDGAVPDGWRVWEAKAPPGPEYEVYGGKVLLREENVVDHRHLVKAEAVQELHPGGPRWSVSVELNAEGARRFDEAAKTLCDRRPPGLLAILIDGVVVSMPVVRSPEFRGKAVLAGSGNEAEAKETARLWMLGALDVPLELEVERKAGK
jgi:preprotein translocase subunit SecD